MEELIKKKEKMEKEPPADSPKKMKAREKNLTNVEWIYEGKQ